MSHAESDKPQRRRPRTSLRFRLTLWVVAVFTVIQISLSLVFFLYQKNSVDEFFSERLRLRSGDAAQALAERAPSITDADLREMAARQLSFIVFEGFAITVYDENGALVASSRTSPPDVPRSMIDGALADPRIRITRNPLTFVSQSAPDADEARVASLGFRGKDGKRYVLIAATADTYAQRTLALAANVLIGSLPIGIVAAFIAGWFIAGIAIAPLREIRRVTTAMDPKSLGEKIQFDTHGAELVELEAEWERMRRRIEAAFMAKERFMANVSHELKTPVSVLLMESQVLDLNGATDDVREFVSSTQEELRRLARLVDSFLLLTRAVDGRRPPASRSCPVNDLIMDSVEECSTWAALHHVYVVPKLLGDDHTLDAAIDGDPDLLRTMLNNLVLNATRFSPIHERITITPTVDNGDVLIAVRDRGPGIPETLLGRVFERGTQGEDERRRGRGSGLGLEIARGIAELHHGDIRVRNCDPGCEFIARIPRAEPPTPQPPRTKPA